MVRNLVYLIIFIIIGFFISCIDEPELPPEPAIKLKSFGFKPANDLQDSLIIEISFKDGDGDLGLITFDTLPPFHEMDSVMKFDKSGYIKLKDRENKPYDTLPPYDPNVLCRYWETVVPGDSNTVFYVKRNIHHFNFHCDILVKQNNGSWKVYDFQEERCSPGLYSRFYPLNTTGKERPLEGILRYGTPSAFKLLFPTQTLKLRISIEDRKLNRSNVVETKEFKLSDFIDI